MEDGLRQVDAMHKSIPDGWLEVGPDEFWPMVAQVNWVRDNGWFRRVGLGRKRFAYEAEDGTLHVSPEFYEEER